MRWYEGGEPLVGLVSPKIKSDHRRALRDCSYCHPRRISGTGPARGDVAASRTTPTGHPHRNACTDLLLAGCVGAALVSRPHRCRELGRDHRISRATAYRYLDEVIAVLADQAPDLHHALRQAHEQNMTHLILDGTVLPTDRLSEKTTSVQGKTIDLWYSGKARTHGGNIQAISAPSGFPLWISEVEAGSTHDLTAAREHVLPALYAAAAQGLPTLADGGYDGTGIGVHTPIKQPADGQVLATDNRTYNALLRGLCSLGERGFALLTQRWRALRHITASPRKIGSIVQAALVLTHLEHRTTPSR